MVKLKLIVFHKFITESIVVMACMAVIMITEKVKQGLPTSGTTHAT